MQNPPYAATNLAGTESGANESTSSAVSWSAIFAGTISAVAMSAILVSFGAGVGFASMSPWSGEGVSAKGIAVMTIIWLIIVQWVASGLGGYLTGRLREKWVGVHTHEVFFRDTAHGFLSWALATVAGLFLLSFMATHAMHAAAEAHPHIGGKMSAHHEGMAPKSENDMSPLTYYTDSMFRSEKTDLTPADESARMETQRILIKDLKDGEVNDTDKTYLTQLVSTHTGLSQADAEKRVNDVLDQEKNDETKMKQMADAGRKAMATLDIFTFLSMLIGAFIACVAAALGGRHRDEGYAPITTITV